MEAKGCDIVSDASFGFVAICLSEHQCSPAGNVTVKSVAGLDASAVQNRIRRTATRNLENTVRIMHFLRGHDLHLYRLSANLVPLATHEIIGDWAWWDDSTLHPLFVKLGQLIHKNEVRISSHLPQVCVLSTPDASVLKWLHLYIEYHQRMFEAMGLDERAKLILHVGGAYNDPKQALVQAEENFSRLVPWAQQRLVLENDDKSFSAEQVLTLTERIGIPMVFDYHHHVIRNDEEVLDELLSRAFATWQDRPPKVHLSSPKSDAQRRAHADNVEWTFVEPFFEAVSRIAPKHVDIMVEAKRKDLALFALQEAYLKKYS